MRGVKWQDCAVALAVLLGSACVGLVSVVWAQNSELAVQKERVDSLKGCIVEMRESLEKKLDKLESKLDEHMREKP